MSKKERKAEGKKKKSQLETDLIRTPISLKLQKCQCAYQSPAQIAQNKPAFLQHKQFKNNTCIHS